MAAQLSEVLTAPIPPPYAGASLKRGDGAAALASGRTIPPPYAGASLKLAAARDNVAAQPQFPRPTRGPH